MFLLTGVLVVLARVTGQLVTPCDQMYEYVDINGHLTGRIPLENPGGDLKLRVTIWAKLSGMQYGQIYDGLELEEDPTKMNQRLNYYVHFPVKNPLPIITIIKFNGQVICRTEVPASAEHFFSTYTHTTKGRTPVGPALLSLHSSYMNVGSFQVLSSGHELDFSGIMAHRPRPTARPITTTTTIGPSVLGDQMPSRFRTTTMRPATMATKTSKDEEDCGLSVRPRPLMLGGREVEKGDYPWIATVYSDSTMTLVCAGVLVNKRFVVLAAHCVNEYKKKEDKLIVIMGKYDFSQWAERDLQPREVQRIFIHPGFEATSMANDMALLYLEDEVAYNMYVRPICLGDDDTSMESFPQQMGTVIGWNPDENLPRLALVPIISEESCRTAITDQPLSENTFCAGNLTASKNCIGDTEGGLIMQKKGKSGNLSWYLRGIASTRLQEDAGTCQRGGYVVFTDVSQYTTWIRKVVKTTRPYGE